jgi:hypothetical protein
MLNNFSCAVDSSVYLLLKNLNCRYGEGIQNCDIYKNASHTEIKDNIIKITLKKQSSSTWYEYFLSIQNEKKELTMECKIAVTIIRHLYEGYNLDEMIITLLEQQQYESSTTISSSSTDANIKEAILYKHKNRENYLSHTIEKLCFMYL